AEDKFDLIAIGRPFIANPDYVAKVRKGEELVAYSDEMLASLI
ncbi:MAG: alkene reductase, partial [Shewanella sp.]